MARLPIDARWLTEQIGVVAKQHSHSIHHNRIDVLARRLACDVLPLGLRAGLVVLHLKKTGLLASNIRSDQVRLLPAELRSMIADHAAETPQQLVPLELDTTAVGQLWERFFAIESEIPVDKPLKATGVLAGSPICCLFFLPLHETNKQTLPDTKAVASIIKALDEALKENDTTKPVKLDPLVTTAKNAWVLSPLDRTLASLRSRILQAGLGSADNPSDVLFYIYRSDWQACHMDRALPRQIDNLDVAFEPPVPKLRELLAKPALRERLNDWAEEVWENPVRLQELISRAEAENFDLSDKKVELLQLWGCLRLPRKSSMSGMLLGGGLTVVKQPRTFGDSDVHQLTIALEQTYEIGGTGSLAQGQGKKNYPGPDDYCVVVTVNVFGQPRLLVWIAHCAITQPEGGANQADVFNSMKMLVQREDWSSDVVHAVIQDFVAAVQRNLLFAARHDLHEAVLKALPLLLNLRWCAAMVEKAPGDWQPHSIKHVAAMSRAGIDATDDPEYQLISVASNDLAHYETRLGSFFESLDELDWSRIHLIDHPTIHISGPSQGDEESSRKKMLIVPLERTVLDTSQRICYVIELEEPSDEVDTWLSGIGAAIQGGFDAGLRQLSHAGAILKIAGHDFALFWAQCESWYRDVVDREQDWEVVVSNLNQEFAKDPKERSWEFYATVGLGLCYFPVRVWRDFLNDLRVEISSGRSGSKGGPSENSGINELQLAPLLAGIYAVHQAVFRGKRRPTLQLNAPSGAIICCRSDIEFIVLSALINPTVNAIQHGFKNVDVEIELDEYILQVTCINDVHPNEWQQKIRRLEGVQRAIADIRQGATLDLSALTGVKILAWFCQKKLAPDQWRLEFEIDAAALTIRTLVSVVLNPGSDKDI